jgi:hypothetical protein
VTGVQTCALPIFSTKDRVFGGVPVPGGEPFQHLDDSVE